MPFYENFPCRLVCSVLDEMRAADKTKDYSNFISMLDEADDLLLNMLDSAQQKLKRILDESSS